MKDNYRVIITYLDGTVKAFGFFTEARANEFAKAMRDFKFELGIAKIGDVIELYPHSPFYSPYLASAVDEYLAELRKDMDTIYPKE